MPSRRLFLSGLATTLACPSVLRAAGITVTDVAGRRVNLAAPARRIALAEARQLPEVAIVADDFDQRLVGLGALKRFDTELQRDWFARFPGLSTLPAIDGDRLPSAEKIVASGADLLVLSGGSDSIANSAALADRMAGFGIPTIFIDFRADPLSNTVPSIQTLGAALGRPDRAQAYVDFIEKRKKTISDRLQGVERPRVFLQLQAEVGGPLTSPGSGGVGAMIEAAGGRNIGAGVVPGIFGPLADEYLVGTDPEVWIGSGGTHFKDRQGIVTGPDVSEAMASASLTSFLDGAPLIAGTTAARTGRTHGLWHNFLNTSFNFVALERMATWFQPELFDDVRPDETLAALNARFLPVPLTGTLSVSSRA